MPDFSLEALTATFEASTGAGLDAGLPDETRFLGSVVKAILARNRATGATDGNEPSLYFLAPVLSELRDSATHRSLFAQGGVRLAGSMWFMNQEARYGDGVEHSLDGEGLLQMCRDTPELARVATLLYAPSAAESPILFFPKGVADEHGSRIDYELAEVTSVSIAACNQTLDNLHAQALRAPGDIHRSLDRLWGDPRHHVAHRKAERRIQAQVRAALIGAFPGIHATEEEMTPAGRLDVGLQKIDGNRTTFLGLLELKVLRQGTRPTGGISDGISQAAAYRDQKRSPWAQVCCFDMRNVGPGDPDPLDEHRDAATRLGIEVRRWQLFPSVAHLRQYNEAASV